MSGSSKSYFDAIGGGWDRLRESFFSDRVREAALTRAGVETGGTAADLGAGTGFITGGLLERGVQVIAVDQSEAMLEALRRKFPSPDQVQCRAGNAESLPIADASVNHCFANMYLHHVETPLLAIKEMLRVLEPGGMAVVTDLDAHDFAFLKEEHRDRWMGFARDDIRRWFGEAGFTDVRVDSIGEECCTTSSGAGEKAVIGIFIASGKRPDS